MAPGVMRNLPSRVDNRPFPHLHDAVAGLKACGCGGGDKVYVSPLIAMVVNVYGVGAAKVSRSIRLNWSLDKTKQARGTSITSTVPMKKVFCR